MDKWEGEDGKKEVVKDNWDDEDDAEPPKATIPQDHLVRNQGQGPSKQKENLPVTKGEKERIKRQNNIVLLNFQMQPVFPATMKSTVAAFFKQTLKVLDVDIVEVSMKRNPCGWKGPSPILVRLTSLEDKEAVMAAAGRLKGTGISVTSDLSDRDIETWRQLVEHMRIARDEGKVATVQDHMLTLFIDGIPFVMDGNQLVQRGDKN